MTPLRSHCDCCVMVSLLVTLQWCHFVTLMWPSFGDYIVKLLIYLSCDEHSSDFSAHSDFTVESLNVGHMRVTM